MLGHPGWRGVSDPMSRSVFTDAEALQWHTVQARTRALMLWADDPRGGAQVPGLVLDVSYPGADDHSFEGGVHADLEGDGDTIRVVVWLKPYMLHPDWDLPAHPPTWLVEFVDGPVGGGMRTIAWPAAETDPPDKIEARDPAGGAAPLPYYLRDTDSINGIARYTFAGTCRVEALSQPVSGGGRRAVTGPGGDAL